MGVRLKMNVESGREEIGNVDPRIAYPCYKSFDDLIDVERLRSLDEYITEGIRVLSTADIGDYFLNEHRLEPASLYQPGVREVWLSRTRDGVPYDYLDLDKPSLWQRTPAAEQLPRLMEFIETLPFKGLGRMLIIYDEAGNAVPAHRDHLSTGICHDFIWFRTNLSKPFYVLDEKTAERLYVRSYSAWFDTVNQFHGTDATPGLSFSIRVDGLFNDQLKQRIPVPRWNAASTPALWACTTE